MTSIFSRQSSDRVCKMGDGRVESVGLVRVHWRDHGVADQGILP